MSSLNKVMLIGNLGEEVKMKYFEGGNCIGSFSLATNEKYINKSTGEKVTTTEWHNIVVRNKAAEVCEQYLSKGDKIYIEGKIKTRSWIGEEGIQKYITEILCLEFKFLTNKKQSPEPASNSSSAVDQYNNNKTEKPYQKYKEPEEDDDLPF